jgi:hypothetical protein
VVSWQSLRVDAFKPTVTCFDLFTRGLEASESGIPQRAAGGFLVKPGCLPFATFIT